MDDFFFQYWAYNIPNYALALVMYVLLARFFVQFLVPPTWDNYIWRSFQRLTDWAVAATRWITPSYVDPVFLPALGAFWCFLLRVGFYWVMFQAGLAPPVVTEG